MSKKSTLLNEVIADAKAVKHTAEQAAMATLREAFQPTINRLVSQKLAEEGDLEDDEPIDAPEPEIDLDAPTDDVPEAPAPEVEDDEEDVDLDEILRELEGDEMEDDMELEEMDDEENPDLFTEEDDEMYESEDMLDDTLDEIINEVEDEMEDEEDVPAPTATNEVKRLRLALKRTKLQLKEAHLAIATQKSALTEVNILNTKLTFATRLMKSFQLDEANQTKILKAFDRAKTIREVKLVYSVLVESLNKLKTNKLTESINKRPQAVNPTQSTQYSYASRWQKLAGIK